ncbi:MAG: hydroxyethylthiazole kinase [Mucinivorans sp.]
MFDFSKDLAAIRLRRPLVHNITNYVVMNSTANALLAMGASPVMAHAKQEVEELASAASSVVLNMGTLSESWIHSMVLAARAAAKAGVPIVVDPVGVGATQFRAKTILELLSSCSPAIIRGNSSEIMATAELYLGLPNSSRTKGVDAMVHSIQAVDMAVQLSRKSGAVVVVSGVVDYIVSGEDVFENHYGTTLMSRVTGMGCTSSAVCGAFVAVNANHAQAALHAMQFMGICGERVFAKVGSAPGSFQVALLDEFFTV